MVTKNVATSAKIPKLIFLTAGLSLLLLEILVCGSYGALLIGFGAFGALVLHFLLERRGFEAKFEISAELSLTPGLIYLLSSSLILLASFDALRSDLLVVPAIICASFLPGHFLLDSLMVRTGTMERIVLSYALSFVLTALLSFSLLPFKEPPRFKVLASLYLLISLFFLGFKLRRLKTIGRIRVRASDLLSLLFSISFPLSIISLTYPGIVYLRNVDISRHYMLSITLERAKNLYPQLDQLFFHLYEMATMRLSKASYAAIQTALTASGLLMVVLSFFLMARTLTKKAELANVSTLMWSTFSGLGWAYLVKRAIVRVTPEVMRECNLATYYDTSFGNSSWIFLWFRPITVAYTFFFLLVHMAQGSNEFEAKYVLPLMAGSLYFIHLPELMIFALSLALSQLMDAGEEQGISRRMALKGTVTGVTAGFLLYAALNLQFKLETRRDTLLATLLMVLVMLTANFLRRNRKKEISSGRIRSLSRWALFAYLWGFMTWILLANEHWGEGLLESQYVPLFYYPIFFGIPGFLLVKGGFTCKSLPYVTLALALLFGKALSILRAEYAWVGYAERRVIPLAFAFACILASEPLVRLHERLRSSAGRGFLLLFLFLLFSFGIGSNICMVRYYNEASDKLGPEEIHALAKIRSMYEENPNLTLYPVTYKSLYSLDHAQRPLGDLSFPFEPRSEAKPFAYITRHEGPVPWPYLWEAKLPHLPLRLLLMADDPHIYLGQADFFLLERNYSGGYMSSYLLESLPTIIRTESLAVLPLFDGTPPSAHSRAAVLLKSSGSGDMYVSTICTILSMLSCNYTTRVPSDLDVNEIDVILLGDERDPELVEKTLDLVRKGKFALVFGVQGYSNLSDLFFEWANISLKSEGGFIHLAENYPKEARELTPQFRGNSIELILDNDESEGLILVDDNQTRFWVASGIGTGNLSIPVLSDDPRRVSGANSLRIEVKGREGDFAQWQISHVFDAPQDWSGYEFLTFYWYGKGDGKRYLFILLSPGRKNFIYYQFEDSWNGWRKVLLPLNLPEGLYEVSGVRIWKGSVGEPSLKEVRKMLLKLSPQNVNVSGTWFLDRISLERGSYLKLRVRLPVKLLNLSKGAIEMLAFNSTRSSFQSILSLDLGKVLKAAPTHQIIERIPLMDGSSSDLFFPEGAGSIATWVEGEGLLIEVMVKVPPEDGLDSEDFGLSQCRLLLRANLPIRASKLMIMSQELGLDGTIEPQCIVAKKGVEVLASYVGEGSAPLISKARVGEGTIIYLNLVPLFSQLPMKKALNLSLAAIESLKGAVPLRKARDVRSLDGDLLLFKSLSAEGNASLYSRFISLLNQSAGLEVLVDGREVRVKGLESMVVRGSAVIVRGKRVRVLGGAGFYALVEVENPMIEARSASVKISSRVDGREDELKLSGDHVEARIFGKVQFLSFRPRLEVAGRAFIEGCWTYYPLYPKFRAQGQNLELEGKVNVKILISDVYSISECLEFEGRFRREPPVLKWKPVLLLEALVAELGAATLLLVRARRRERIT